jgi:hypothetical protein
MGNGDLLEHAIEEVAEEICDSISKPVVEA